MKSPDIAIVVEAGDWPQEPALEALARRAVDAAVEAIGAAGDPSPLSALPPEGARGEAGTDPPSLRGRAGGFARRVLGRRREGGSVQAEGISFADLRLSPKRGGTAGAPELSPELSIVFTDDAAMRKLNMAYRGKDSATNVLSFPQAGIEPPAGVAGPQLAGMLLGDVILSAETVAGEAALADKPLEDHMAHLIIHGFLHLLGYDHETGREAEKMEQLERVALKTLGIPDPYASA